MKCGNCRSDEGQERLPSPWQSLSLLFISEMKISSLIFKQIFNSMQGKNTHLSYIFKKNRVSYCIHVPCQGKHKYQNVGVKSKLSHLVV